MKGIKTFVISIAYILLNLVIIHTSLAAVGPTTYYSRGNGGPWTDRASWTLSPDGSGPRASSVPQRNDHVVILSGSDIIINRRNANGSSPESPRSLGHSGFGGNGRNAFYHTGDITIRNGGTLTSWDPDVMIAGNVTVENGGTIRIEGNVVNLGQFVVQEGSTFRTGRDLVLLGTSENIINNNSNAGRALLINEQQAMLCGTGGMSIGQRIQESNGADASQQICDTFVISCDGNCGTGTGNSFEGSGDIILPVELLSFEGYATDNYVALEWTTAMEENFDFFTVERAGDNRKFEVIGTLQGQGNSTVEVDYSFTDDAPLPGQALYRLKATDIDGTVEYHRIISVYFDGKGLSDVNVYPNPVSQNNFVVKTQQADIESIQLMDLAGRSMLSQSAMPGENRVSLPQDIRPGAYLLILRTSSGQQHQQRIMVL